MTETPEETRTADCYSDRDRKMMDWWAGLRARSLNPLLAVMSRAGVTADGVTLWSFVLGMAFCPMFLVNRPVALVCLWLHVLVDGLDGPLARYRGTASPKGSFADTLCDQTVVAASTAILILDGVVHSLAGGLYIFVYTVVVTFAMIRNAMTVPYSFILRPRFIVYAWVIVELYLWPATLNKLLWILLVPLTWQLYRGFRTIRRKL